MIIVAAKFKTKPGMRDKVAEISRHAIDCTRKEKGNISYTLYKSTDDEETLLYFEEWEDIESLRAHLKTQHVLDAREARKDMLAAPAEVRVFDSKEVAL
jgi:quinol monooxygenase YgiN